MATPVHVLDELRAYLISEGAVQDWNTTPGATPGVMLAPKDGAPLPRVAQGEQSTVTLRQVGTAMPMNNMEAYLEGTAVDVIVRSTSAPTGRLIQRAIRGLIHPTGHYAGQKLWTMNTLLVERSFQWRQESELPPPPATQGSQQQNLTTYDTVQAFAFECRRKALDGLPYVP